MRFKIDASSIWTDKANKILESFPCLKDFGFEAVESKKPYNIPIRDENNKRIYQEAYKIVKEPFVNIDSLEQLIALQNAVDNPIIVSNYDGLEIEIYDGYRE